MERKKQYKSLSSDEQEKVFAEYQQRLEKPLTDKTTQTLAFAKDVAEAEGYLPKKRLVELKDNLGIDPGDWSRLKMIGTTSWLYDKDIEPLLPRGGESKLSILCKLGGRIAIGLLKKGTIDPTSTRAQLQFFLDVKKGKKQKAPDGKFVPKLPGAFFAGVYLPRMPEGLDGLAALKERLDALLEFIEPLGGAIVHKNGLRTLTKPTAPPADKPLPTVNLSPLAENAKEDA